MIPVNNLDTSRGLSRFVMAMTNTERSIRLRARRRRGRVMAALQVDPIEMRKLVALGYLGAGAIGKGAALNAAVEAFFSDKLAEEDLS